MSHSVSEIVDGARAIGGRNLDRKFRQFFQGEFAR